MPYRLVSASMLAGLSACLWRCAKAYMGYVSNEKDNTATVVDLDKLEVVRIYPVGQRPRGITMTKDGKYVRLCASDDDAVQVINLVTVVDVDANNVLAREGYALVHR